LDAGADDHVPAVLVPPDKGVAKTADDLKPFGRSGDDGIPRVLGPVEELVIPSPSEVLRLLSLVLAGVKGHDPVAVHHGAPRPDAETVRSRLRMERSRPVLPVHQVFAGAVSPVNVAPVGSTGIGLVKDVVLAFPVDGT